MSPYRFELSPFNAGLFNTTRRELYIHVNRITAQPGYLETLLKKILEAPGFSIDVMGSPGMGNTHSASIISKTFAASSAGTVGKLPEESHSLTAYTFTPCHLFTTPPDSPWNDFACPLQLSVDMAMVIDSLDLSTP